MSKPVIVSGIQPTGLLHIGNYLGALKNWVDLQNSGKYDCFFFLADYHSITENYSPAEKKEQIFNLVCDYLASGLDPKKSTIFVQSQIPECTELAWIFNTLTPIGELERMTQFKDKSNKQVKNINAGLLTYPILQAADILIYHGEFVPVGQDQVQHLELAHDTVKWFNNKYATEYFKDVKGKKAKGEGKVVYVLPVTKEQYKIRILTSASTPHKGYNVLLFTNQDASLDLNKGDLVIFEGQVERVIPYQGANLDIYGTYKKSGVK